MHASDLACYDLQPKPLNGQKSLFASSAALFNPFFVSLSSVCCIVANLLFQANYYNNLLIIMGQQHPQHFFCCFSFFCVLLVCFSLPKFGAAARTLLLRCLLFLVSRRYSSRVAILSDFSSCAFWPLKLSFALLYKSSTYSDRTQLLTIRSDEIIVGH